MRPIVLAALVVCCVGATQTSAQPPVNQLAERSNLLKPVEVAKNDSLIVKLKKERFNERLKLHQRLGEQYAELGVVNNPAKLTTLIETITKLADEGAELEAHSKDRVKWHEMKIEHLAHVEKHVGAILESPMPSSITRATLSTIKLARLDAEIQLLELKAEIEKTPKK